MDQCLSEDAILDFVGGRLSPDALAETEAHADRCAACTELIAAAAGAVLREPPSSRRSPASERSNARRIGAYRLVEPLGHGGAGIVYRAVHVVSGDEVALKMVRAETRGVLTSIRREIRALSRVDHPGVVRILDQGVDEGRPWYAMDLVAGHTLHEHLQSLHAAGGGAIDARRASILGVIRRLCGTLAVLHGQGVVHRDLTPRNVIVRPDGSPVLVDFGLALRNPRPGRDLVEAAVLVGGTPRYMSPEQIRGDVIDPRADLYALGAILYHVVVGRPPFTAPTPLEIAMAHLEQAPEPPSVAAPWIDPALETLILRLLAKRPRDRVGYAEDVAAALAPFCAPAEPANTTPRARPYVYRPGFVGRNELVGRFDGLLDDAARGRGAAVLVGGASGVGKTRLAVELAARARALGFRVVVGECAPSGERAAALYPLRPLLRALADALCDRDSVVRLDPAHARALAVFEPELGALAGEDPPESTPFASQGARRKLLDALEAALGALVSEAPLLLVLDDLQWADELSLDFLEALPPDFFATHHVLFAGTYRDDETSPQLDRTLRAPFANKVALGNLPRAAIEAMAGEMLALDHVPAPLIERLSSASEGNAFFVAEYLHAAVDEGWIVRDPGSAWRLADDGPTSVRQLPGSLAELVRRRFAALTPPSRRLLEAAAVLGKKAETDVLVATAELAEGEGLDALGELVASSLLEEAGDDGVRLVHDKLREIAYAAIDDDRRRALHRRAAQVIERHRAAPSDAVLAHHWACAGAVAKAIDHLERAGEAALRTAAHAEAAACFERALRLHAAADLTGAASRDRRARWERRLGEACYALGDLRRCEVHSSHALTGFGYTQPRTRLGWAVLLAKQLARQIRHVAAPARVGPPSAEERARLQEASLAAARLAHGHYFAEDGLALVASGLLSVNLAEEGSATRVVTEPYAQLGYLAGTCRLRSLADRYFGIAKRGAEAAGDALELATVLSHEALYLAGAGRLDEARGAAERALAGLSSPHDPQESGAVRTILAHIDYLAGRNASSMAHASRLLASAMARAHRQHEAFGRYALVRCLLREARFDEALDHLERVRALLDGRPEGLFDDIRLGLTAVTHLGRGDLALAERAADAVLTALAESRPSPFSLADGCMGAAEVYLDLWRRSIEQRSPTGTLPARARRAGAAMRRNALLFPVGAPGYLLFLGRERALAGYPTMAAWTLRRARRRAGALGLVYEAAQAERALDDLTT